MNLSISHTSAEDFSKYETDYRAFLRQIKAVNAPAYANMGDEGPHGFLYLVENNKRWTADRGQIALLYDNDKRSIVGISAVEHSTLHDDLGSGGNRLWVLPKYRQNNVVSKYLLNHNMQWCADNNKVGMLLTFNDYNKKIYDSIKKFSSGQGAALGNIWSDWWNDCAVLPRMIRLHNTPQWAVIKPVGTDEEVADLVATIDERFGVRDTPFIKSQNGR